MNSTATPLSAADRETLARESWIDAATADAWGIHRVSSTEGAVLVGRTDREDYKGMVFPIYWPGEARPRECFLRRDHPPMEHRNGKLKPKQKYLAPPGRGNLLLFGPSESPPALTDTGLPIVLVEGLKKLCADWRLSRLEQDAPRFLACGVSGVWNFKGTIGKTTDAHGARVSIQGIIADFERVVWKGRRVFLVYDSDSATNPSVRAAREALDAELRGRGAQVVTMYLPALDGLEKTGFDDLLARWDPQAVLDWLQAAQTEAASGDDPEPITLDPMAVPQFQTRVIPCPWLRDMIEAAAVATETPVELAALLGLAVVASTVHKTFAVEAEPGYMEPLNLWVCPALESGNRKTAVLRAMTAPLLDYERRRKEMMAPEIQRAESARQLAEDRIKFLRQKAVRAEGTDADLRRQELFEAEEALPVVPVSLRLWTQDVTPEKLGQLMQEHGEKMALLSDEGGLFDILAGRYSQGIPNLDLFVQAYSGSPYRVDRGSRPPVFLQSPTLTIALSPQPDVLRGLAKIPGFRGKGLLARWLYAFPVSTLGSRDLIARPIPSDIRQTYQASLDALLALSPRADGAAALIRLADDALQEWKGFQRHVEDEMQGGGMFEHIRDWASKLPGGVVRLAGVLHCAEQASDDPGVIPISLMTMEAALELAALLERHALMAFSLMAVDSSLNAAQKVWAWIARQQRATFSKRDCFDALKGTFPEMAGIQPAFDILVERGYLFPLSLDRRVGRPSPRYRVNRRLTKEWPS